MIKLGNAVYHLSIHLGYFHLHFKGARILKASHFLKRYQLGRKISFVCVATGKPRPQITWLKDGLELNSYSGYEHVGVSMPGVSLFIANYKNK